MTSHFTACPMGKFTYKSMEQLYDSNAIEDVEIDEIKECVAP